MFNQLHALFHRPEKGYDPVSAEHAKSYAASEWDWYESDLVVQLDHVESLAGNFAGKRILDLGGGPGQYSVAFARRGATVTWHDISARYRTIAQEQAAAHDVSGSIDYSLGYLEDAARLPAGSYDMVWCRICWYYCMNDAAFARMIHRLIKPGGCAWIDSPQFPITSTKGRIVSKINQLTGIKIGHPCPPPGRIESLFRALPLKSMKAETIAGGNEQIFLVKPD